MIKAYRIILLTYFTFGFITAQTQTNFSIGDTQTLHSSILNEDRRIFVYAPRKTNIKIPLILVFDGETLFEPTVSALRFMNRASEIPQLPEALVIGIPNVDRIRDMPIPQQFGEKGENKFMQFLSNELLPYLNSKYALNGHTISIGHSQGGLFVSYLLSKAPHTFSWVVALDAPMNVEVKTKNLNESISILFKDQKTKSRYISIETLYGWEKQWENYFAGNENAKKIKLPDESHESMPFKGIYDGIKFLYRDFAPPRKDMNLSELKIYYASLSEKYGYPYEIPLKVMLASAGRKQMENRKKEIMELLQYAEEKYGFSERIAALKTKAEKITKEHDPLLDYYLNLPKPSPDEVKKYLGKWQGDLIVKDGQNMLLDIEISIQNGKPTFFSRLPWDPATRVEAEIFGVSADGKLIFGRRNRGSGLVISTASLNKKGQLEGEEWLVGFAIQDDFPPDVKERMNFILTHPNTFILSKKL